MKHKTGPMASRLLAIEAVVLVAVMTTACLPIAGAFACSGAPAAASVRHRLLPGPLSRAVRPAGSVRPAGPLCRAVARAEVSAGVYTFDAGGSQVFRCSFKRKPASPGKESDPPLLLVHPVGIGLSSWFWDKFLAEWEGGEVFAPDLIGCGDSDPWLPAQAGMFVPLDWVRAIEALWAQEIRRKCVVVVQGGLGPVGVQLAARQSGGWDGSRAVAGLVLASPPSFDAMRAGLDSDKVASNWKWLTSPPGQLSYYLLRSRPFVKFFSDLFLFAGAADPKWLDDACAGATPDARYPVFAFNAGLVIAKGFVGELAALDQRRLPMLVLSGAHDSRSEKREASAASLGSCRLARLPGKNVLPWENPSATAEAIMEFIASVQ